MHQLHNQGWTQNTLITKRWDYISALCRSKTLHCNSDVGLVTSTEPEVGAWRWCVYLGSWVEPGLAPGLWLWIVHVLGLPRLVLALSCLSEASWPRDLPILPHEGFGRVRC